MSKTKLLWKCCKIEVPNPCNCISLIYNKTKIFIRDIDTFEAVCRSKNDANNNIRENIIDAIINKAITPNFYTDTKWFNLQTELDNYIQEICSQNNIQSIDTIECKRKAGRVNHHDFNLTINEVTYKIEFKYNAECISDTPQFVSPMNPSKFLSENYEEFFYNNYLPILAEHSNLSLPDKETYLKEINSDKPNCMKDYQSKYYNGCKNSSKFTNDDNDIDFYNKSKSCSNDSIKQFISLYELDIEKLSDYLVKTQKNKYYMLYKNGKLKLETINCDNFKIDSYTKNPDKQSYIATTQTGIALKILLRWKNGLGIAFPAFQISLSK